LFPNMDMPPNTRERRAGSFQPSGPDGLITPRLLQLFGIIVAVAWLILLGADGWNHTRNGVVDDKGEQLGRDFVYAWAAPRLAEQGHAASVYSATDFNAFARSLTAPNAETKFYPYPPTYLLLTAPISPLPFLPAYLVWTIGGLCLLASLLRPFLGWKSAWITILASPAVFLNSFSGQNGALTASSLVGGLVILDRRPLLAGALFGLLLCAKPQLVLLAPLALLAGGRWRVLLGMGLTTLALIVLSLVAFGPSPWAAFIHDLPILKRLPDVALNWRRMPTLYAALRLLGAPAFIAYVGQTLSAGVAAICVILVWRGTEATLTKGAVLVLAGFACTPYGWDYDTIPVIFAAAWLWRPSPETTGFPWEKLLLCALLAAPGIILVPILPTFIHGAQIAPLLVLSLLVMRGTKALLALRSREPMTDEAIDRPT
jgi:arabinofuranan 3-O-arabinosyltransferase